MKKRDFIDQVRVKDPCTQAWDEMVGSDKVRFCTHCAKDVNNLSAMTRKEAVKLVRRSGGSLCIRYVQQPETKAPMFAGQLTQISRRRSPLMAAGVMSASLSLATLTYAQGGSNPADWQRPESRKVNACEDVASSEKKNAPPVKDPVDRAIRGTAVDANGAVIPNLPVALIDAGGNTIRTTQTGSEGEYKFEGLELGSYTIRTEASVGFAAHTIENVRVDGENTVMEIPVEVLASITVGGAVVVEREFEGALAIAVSSDDVDAARTLIAAGEDVNAQEDDDSTPIFIAVENGNLEMVALLLDFGAKVNVRNDEKQTPLMMIDGDASLELVELLLRSGAKVNRVADNGDTALIRAAREVKSEVLRALIDAGAELNAQNDEGVTALMNAADNDNLENVRVLLLAGADVNLRDKEGDNAWDYTAEEEIESLLVSHGVVLDPEDYESSGPDDEDEPEETTEEPS